MRQSFVAHGISKHCLLPGPTGIVNGKEYMINVKHVHSSSTIFENNPIGPIQNGPWGMLLRPRMRRHTTGIAYDR